jgi:DHA1 family multidrug resistance protein-like MFS transporter
MIREMRNISDTISILKMFSRASIILLFISLTVQLGFSMLNPVMQYYIEALANPNIPPPEQREAVIFTPEVVWYIAFNTAAFMFVRAPFAAFFGRLSDRIGRRRLIIYGLFLYVIIGIGLGVSTHPIHVVLIRGIQGIVSAMVWPVAEALLMEKVDKRIRTRAMTLYVMALNIANLIGPGIGGWIYHLFYISIGSNKAIDILRPTVLSPVPIFVLAAILSLYIKEGREESKTITREDRQVFRLRDIPEELINRSINVIYFTGIINGFGIGLIVSIIIVYISEFIVKEPGIIGSVMSIGGIIGLLTAYPLASYADKTWGKKNLAIFSMILRTTTFIILPFTRDIPTLLLVLALGNISFNTGMPSLRALQADLTRRKYRGKVFGQQQTAFNSGVGIGALAGALLYNMYAHKTIFNITGVAVLFFTSAILSFITLIAILKWLIDPQKYYEKSIVIQV